MSVLFTTLKQGNWKDISCALLITRNQLCMFYSQALIKSTPCINYSIATTTTAMQALG